MTDSQPPGGSGKTQASTGRTWTERWYRAMLLGYPRQHRERHGGELLGTLLEAHPSRRLPSPRESASLLDAGLLTRLRTRLAAVPAWADGLHLGLLLLALMQAGTVLGRVGTHQQPELVILLPSLLLVFAVLLGRMGIGAVLAAIPAVAATVQAMTAPSGLGTDYLAGLFSTRLVSVEVSSTVSFWLSPGLAQLWVIALGSALLAVRGRSLGALPRRSWYWLLLPLAQAAFSAYSRTLAPALPPLGRPSATGPMPALSFLPLLATVVLLLLALRATAVLGDGRWAVAAGVYLLPSVIVAVAVVSVQPSAFTVFSVDLPAVLLTGACAVVLRRGAAGRARG